MKMELEEVFAQKRVAEGKIFNILKEFESNTKLSIQNVSLDHGQKIGFRGYIIMDVSIKVEL